MAVEYTHPLHRIETAALVAIGGFVGADLRYVTGLLVPWIWGTLAVNVAGAFLLGFVLFEARVGDLLGDRTRLVVATGFLSSFTTYSAFVLETATLPRVEAAGYVVATTLLGVLAVVAGRWLAVRTTRGWP